MSTTCLLPGWGFGTWGTSPWGGSLVAAPGGPLPVADPFDIFCVGPCGPMAVILTHPEVTTFGDGASFTIGVNQDLVISSGATISQDARLAFNVPVPPTFTLDFTCQFVDLPPDFNDLVNEHIYVQGSDSAGPTFGLFFSKIGMAYVGAVHHDGGGNLVVDSAVQPLPNSQVLVPEGEYISFRIAVDMVSQRAYIYATKTADLTSIGHQLRYVLPAFLSSGVALTPPDEVLVSVRGTVPHLATVSLNTICLGSGIVAPNVPPRADAGPDQASRTCAIIQLDGSRSVDPEGAALTYMWRLIAVPHGSKFIFDGVDGRTYPFVVPTGFTNKFHSVSLGTLDGVTPLTPGDVLVIQGLNYKVMGKGTDLNGFYATVDGDSIPDSLPALTPFKYIRQNGISGATTVHPTFYPDIAGLYKFDLIVFDGVYASDPSEVIVNVTESPIPRGVVPDLSFMWDYLSDFWRLVEDRERIEVFWSALAQIASAELLALWQIDYSKSLRDVQRVFQRKWIHYDLLLNEPFPDLTKVKGIFGGVESSNIPNAGIAGVAGQVLNLFLSTQLQIVQIYFSGAGLLTAQTIADRINAYLHAINPLVVASVISNTAGTSKRVRIDAPFAFAVDATSTVTIFGLGTQNTIPKGTGGSVLGARVYRVERSLKGVNVSTGDFLSVGGNTYRIARVVSDASDEFPSMRITLLDDIPALEGSGWLISGQATSTQLDFFNGLITAGDAVTFEVVNIATNVMALVMVPATGSSDMAASVLGVDTTLLGQYLYLPNAFEVFLKSVVRRQHTPISPLVVDVPYLQQHIKNPDDKTILRRNLDFFLETFRGTSSIRFVVDNDVTRDVWEGGVPPDRLWAEMTYLDNRPTIEANFGLPAQFTLDDLAQLPTNIDYLSAVRGLWYAYFTGPTLFNLRAGAQILLGLPFAEEEGTIEEIRNDFSNTHGRMLVRDTVNTEIVRSYDFPSTLPIEINPATGLPYTIGSMVKQFAPLVKGVDVIDWVKDSRWFEGYLNQGLFHEIEKFFKFLVRVDSEAFSLAALIFVKTFILRIKPNSTFPVFVVRAQTAGPQGTEIETTAVATGVGTLSLQTGSHFNRTRGAATMFDQQNPAGGGPFSRFDTDSSPLTSLPTFPTPDLLVSWGFDKYWLSPEDNIYAKLIMTLVAPTVPTVDGDFFQLDGLVHKPIWSALLAQFYQQSITGVPAGPAGLRIGADEDFIITQNGSIDYAEVYFTGDHAATGVTAFDVDLYKNGVLFITLTLTVPAAPQTTSTLYSTSIPAEAVSIGDTIRAVFRADDNAAYRIEMRKLQVFLGTRVDWDVVNPLAAGTYYNYRPM